MFSSLDKAIADVGGRRADDRSRDEADRRLRGMGRAGHAPASAAASGRRAADAGPASGVAFLAAKKAARDATADARAAAVAAADEAFRRLARHARDAPRARAPAGARHQSAGSRGRVPRDDGRAGEFKAEARRQAAACASAGADLALDRSVARLQLRGVTRRETRTSTTAATAEPEPQAFDNAGEPAASRRCREGCRRRGASRRRPSARNAPPKLALRRRKRRRRRDRQVGRIIDEDESTLLDLIDNLLNKGVMLNADLILALANVDLVYLRLSALLCAADRVMLPVRREAPKARRRT